MSIVKEVTHVLFVLQERRTTHVHSVGSHSWINSKWRII